MATTNNKTNPSASERFAYISQKEKEAVELLQTTQQRIPEIINPVSYIKLLQLFSCFHRYSYINVLLIYFQFPQASYIAGFDTWQTNSINIWHNPKRQVLKEEFKGNGIRLLAPYTYAPSKDNRRLMNFIVSVYDVLQTNNIPSLEQKEEYINQINIKKMNSVFRYISPYRIVLSGPENTIIQKGIPGYCNHNDKIIVLNEKLSKPKLLKEAIRQTINAKLILLGYQNEKLNSLIVESVVYVFEAYFNNYDNNPTNNFSFLSLHINESYKDLASALHVIQRISHDLIDAAEDFIKESSTYELFDFGDDLTEFDYEFSEGF